MSPIVCLQLAGKSLIAPPLPDIQRGNPGGVGKGRLLTRCGLSRLAAIGPTGDACPQPLDPYHPALGCAMLSLGRARPGRVFPLLSTAGPSRPAAVESRFVFSYAEYALLLRTVTNCMRLRQLRIWIDNGAARHQWVLALLVDKIARQHEELSQRATCPNS
jgi:hypothetical protein